MFIIHREIEMFIITRALLDLRSMLQEYLKNPCPLPNDCEVVTVLTAIVLSMGTYFSRIMLVGHIRN